MTRRKVGRSPYELQFITAGFARPWSYDCARRAWVEHKHGYAEQLCPMIFDYLDANAPADIEADLCIVGSGAAGLSIARTFVGSSARVCILESGGLRGEHKSQSLNQGKSVGEAKLDAASSRMRAFGGTCNVWGRGCIPLTPQDFEPRSWVPDSGWPLSYGDLESYYVRAQTFCGIDAHKFSNGSSTLRPSVTPIAFDDDDDLVNRFCAQSPFWFGQAYREELAHASNVSVLLHANLLEFIPASGGTSVREARIGSLAGRRGIVRARQYVLACGGIENARLLLLSNSQSANGIGNDHDLVGRYFMDHPTVKLGDLWTQAPDQLTRSYERIVSDQIAPAYPEISLTDACQRQNQVLNCRVRLNAVEGPLPRGIQALRTFRAADESVASEDASIRRRISTAQWPHAAPLTKSADGSMGLVMDLALGAGGIANAMARKLVGLPTVQTDHLEVLGFFEQAPHRESRITLGSETDDLGQRKVQINWQLTDLDWHTYRCAAKLFGENLAKRFHGRYVPERWLSLDGPGDPRQIRGAAHHLGTTRMSPDPSEGVVDVDCRVHGVDNLYVVGSSVFPTGGWAFPTLTIVALSLRLADRLRDRLKLCESTQTRQLVA